MHLFQTKGRPVWTGHGDELIATSGELEYKLPQNCFLKFSDLLARISDGSKLRERDSIIFSARIEVSASLMHMGGAG